MGLKQRDSAAVQPLLWSSNNSQLLYATSALQTSQPIVIGGRQLSVQATVTGTGTVSGTIQIFASNDVTAYSGANTTNWVLLATIGLSGTNSNTDGFSASVNWLYLKAVTTALVGSAITVQVGV